MASKNLAAMIRRKTNRIALVLAYAFLEWILIILLLFDSFFSHLIFRFAEYFGLKRPCLLCSRVDHIFDRKKKQTGFDLMCDGHAMEISKLGFCCSHRKVVGSRDMCEDCSSSGGFSKRFASFPWMKKIGLVRGGSDDEVVENGEVDSIKCSCCGVSIETQISDYTQRMNSIEEEEFHGEHGETMDHNNNTQKENFFEEKTSDDKIPFDQHEDEEMKEETKGIHTYNGVGGKFEEETEEEFTCFISSFDCGKETDDKKEDHRVDLVMEENKEAKMDGVAVANHLEFYIDQQDCHLIPVEFYKSGEEDQQGSYDNNGDLIMDFVAQVAAQAEFVLENSQISQETVAFVSSVEQKQKNEAETLELAELDTEETDVDADQVQASDDGLLQRQNGEETDAEISIGTEIADHEQIDDHVSFQEITPQDDDHGSDQAEDMLEFKTFPIETRKPALNTAIQFSSDLHEIEKENVLETPEILIDLEIKESGTEDSSDRASVTSELDCPDSVLTIEKLKSELKQERKALNALYAELEEERSASAVAANQTMLMINRLQEEKAVIQMEALQYQRMMEEQSEYDQEALQLLNELMVKREKETAELEKELEAYRKKVHEYESTEKIGTLGRARRNSNGSWTTAEDSGGLLVYMNQETKQGFFNEHNDATEHKNTPVDAVLCLDDSLSDLAQERLSILEQLKVLERKLFTLNDDEEDKKDIENGNGHVKENGNGHYRFNFLKSKRLLPFFDAADSEPQDGILNETHYENSIDDSEKSSAGEFANEEEVDELHERLQALEGDREFLRHCVNSLSKGDKGVYLLQQILQNLHDLRKVELCVRNSGDSAP